MNYIKELVDKHKMTKWEIKKKLKTSWNTVNFWYRGIYNPSVENKKKILKLYNDIID